MKRLSSLLNHIRQQAEEARTLDRLRELALLLRRHRGDAARHDLAALRNVTLQELHVLVVDLRRVGARERAGLAAAEKRTARAALCCECHCLFLRTGGGIVVARAALAAVTVAAVTIAEAAVAVAEAAAAITTVAALAVAVRLPHHGGGAFLQLFNADREIPQNVF